MDISKNKYRASVHRHTGGFYLKYYGIIYLVLVAWWNEANGFKLRGRTGNDRPNA